MHDPNRACYCGAACFGLTSFLYVRWGRIGNQDAASPTITTSLEEPVVNGIYINS